MSQASIINLLSELEKWLRNKLHNVRCPACGHIIVSNYPPQWVNEHLPHITVGEEEISVSYRCKKGGLIEICRVPRTVEEKFSGNTTRIFE